MKAARRKALLLVDFINLLDYRGADRLAPRAIAAARQAASLKARARAAGIPCIYANDNYGHWESEFSALVRECLKRKGPSATIARLLRPKPGDRSVLKPRHSAFYGTPLEFLLDELGIRSLIVAGLTADMCVAATAQDAHVREYGLWVPADCVAADTEEHERQALEHLRRTMKADIRPAAKIKSRL